MTALRGTVHGNIIRLEQDPGLPEGQQVTVIVQRFSSSEEGLRQAFGAWADEADDLDRYLEEVQQSRQQGRGELAP
jgi:hypothetical protein